MEKIIWIISEGIFSETFWKIDGCAKATVSLFESEGSGKFFVIIEWLLGFCASASFSSADVWALGVFECGSDVTVYIIVVMFLGSFKLRD